MPREIHGEFSPPSVPGERLPACEGDLSKDEWAAAQTGEGQGMTMFFMELQHISAMGTEYCKTRECNSGCTGLMQALGKPVPLLWVFSSFAVSS